MAQVGRFYILDIDGNLQATPFLDISGDNNGPVDSAGQEQGMLGLAFDPGYATNRQFYVDVHRRQLEQRQQRRFPFLDIVEQFTTKADDPNTADPSSGKIILSVLDYAPNHNGGMIEFGSDGYLYISEGDGGGEGDPKGTGQNPNVLLGKMLRIDVDHPAAGSAYGIPPDNPFAGSGSGAPEIFIMGLRNPWRWSFDSATGDMWIGDVGQDKFEEVDYLPAGRQAGVNLGWSRYEANTCYNGPCNTTGMTFPAIVRSHAGDGWVAMIGGGVYRGTCYPDIVGTYYFADFGAAGFSQATMVNGVVTSQDLPGKWPGGPSSIHADSRGELYMTNTLGQIFHLEAGSAVGLLVP